ncbi:MAG: dihydroneopterin aldolase [Bacteroidales bacterium]|nr:dihydroneopterin aldolase [Bacteroidales bacterium]
MGLIELENMEFYAFHGHYREERIVGNRFLVNVTLETALEKAAQTDSLEDTLNYQKVYLIVKQEMAKKSHLLENIASRILDALYAHFDTIQSAKVKVSKLNPPMGGKMDCVSVTLKR